MALQRCRPLFEDARWNAGVVLVDGTGDLALSVLPGEDPDINRAKILRVDHPTIAGLDPDRWLDWPHVVVSGRARTGSPLDGQRAEQGRSRRVGMVVPGFGVVPDLLRQSDLIAMLPSQVPGAAGLVTLPPPIPVPGFSLHLAWHRRRDGDRALRHVADLLAAWRDPAPAQ